MFADNSNTTSSTGVPTIIYPQIIIIITAFNVEERHQHSASSIIDKDLKDIIIIIETNLVLVVFTIRKFTL